MLADRKRSNSLLQDAIDGYQQLLEVEDVPDALFKAVADRCINRMRFRGEHNPVYTFCFFFISRRF